MGKIDTVLFDFDGTLMDTNDIIINSWQFMFKAVEGKERPLEEVVKTLGEPFWLTLNNAFPNKPLEECAEIYKGFQREKYEKAVKPFSGMSELLVSLKEKGYKVALVTSRTGASTREGLDKYDLTKYFDLIVTADDTDKHKPDPEPIYIALEKLNSKKEESVMIGDTRFDILCAKNADVKSVLVDWSLALPKESRVGEHTPDFVIETADGLFDVLDSIK